MTENWFEDSTNEIVFCEVPIFFKTVTVYYFFKHDFSIAFVLFHWLFKRAIC